MHRLVLILVLVSFTSAMAKDQGSDLDACRKGRVEVARKAADYRGENRIRRLIEADLTRAGKEQAEGDAEPGFAVLRHTK